MVKKFIIFMAAAVVLSAAGVNQVSGAGRRPDEEEAKDESVEYEALNPSGELSEGVRKIKVEAFQYDFDPAEVVVFEGEEVEITAVSTDVTHGLGIQEYGINRTLEPNQEEVITFTAQEPGTYTIHCTVYCGEGHGDMHGKLIVLPGE